MTQTTLEHLGAIGGAGLTACGLTLILTPVIRAVALRRGLVDRPEGNRWSKRVVARLGGVAMFLGFIGAMVLWGLPSRQFFGLLLGATCIFLLGLIDDVRRLPPYTKLVVQLLIGCLVVMSGVRIDLQPWAWLSIPASVLWFVLIINAFNLLDNMDGLAAGVGAVGAAFCILHATLAGEWALASVASIVTGVCIGFLRYNFPPARVFMGDSGSHLLGLSLAVLAVMGSWHQSTHLLSVLVVPALVLAVPIFDTCFVTIQRLTHRLHPFAGGTDHVSHRLAILGLSARQTVLALYGVSVSLGVLSVISTMLRPLAAFALWIVVCTSLILFGRYLSQVKVYQLQEPSLPAGGRWSETLKSTTLIETMLLHKRRLLEIVVDFLLISSAYVFAYLLRFEGSLTGEMQLLVVQSLPIILVIKLASLMGFGLYRGVWRYLGLSDLVTIFKGVTVGSVLSSLALLYLWRFQGYSRAVFIIDWLLVLFAVGSSRVVERLLDEWIAAASRPRVPVLIIGAGDIGERVLRHLRYETRGSRYVVGLIDDDARKHGNRVHGCSVLGGREQLANVLDRAAIREVLVAITDPPEELLRHVRQCCEPREVIWKVVTAGVTDAV